jgi:eukaryotic-like serine/threonine-protein kinase
LPDIFISYSREDQIVARRVAENFEHEGFSVWWDQALHPGEAFDQVTEQALEDARVVVVLWSKTSVNSRWVRAEATQANANNRLLPVMIESCRRPIMFELTHTADLSEWDGSAADPAWRALVAGVRRFLERGDAGNTAAAAPAPPASTQSTTAQRLQQRGATPSPRPAIKSTDSRTTRRKALVYGASGLGLAAAGLAGGAWLGAGGGAAPAHPVSFKRLTFRRGLIRSARFAPDGKTILYGALWDGELCRVQSTRTDNPESRALDVPHGNLLAVSRSGDLAIAVGPHLDGVMTYGTLARVPIAGGAPRELAENVKFADWSSDGEHLAVIRSDGVDRVNGVDRIEYPLGKTLFLPPAGEGRGLGFVRVAPGDKSLAFIHYRDPQSLIGRVCVIDAGGKVRVLTDEYINIHGLAWRGEEIWYTASDDRPLFRSLMVVRPGKPPRVVARMPVNLTIWDSTPDGALLIAQTDDRAAMIGRLPGDAHDRDLSWLDASWVADVSRDGSQVLFSESGQGVGAIPAAYLRGSDGSPAVRLGNGQPLALSPDKRWALILEVDRALAGLGTAVDLVPTGAGDSRRLLQGQRYSAARWLPDGRHFLVQIWQSGKSRVFQVPLAGGEPVPVTSEGIRGWVASPDGSMIAAPTPKSGVHLHSLVGGKVVAVPGSTGSEELVGWVDGGLLVTRRSDPASPRGEIFLLDVATGRQRSWANILPRDSGGIMLMGSVAATPDGRVQVFTWHRALSNLYVASGLI